MEQSKVTDLLLRPDYLFVKRLSPNAILPIKGSDYAAGYDLYTPTNTNTQWIPPFGRAAISTDICVGITPGFYGRIAGRSGLALKEGLDVLGGVIDSDYRGEIKVILYNTTASSVEIGPGFKIAQLIIEKCAHWYVKEVETLDETVRGDRGFGSTGYGVQKFKN